MKETRAIIADDEEALIVFLRTRLAETWPELVICGEAMDLIERHRPDIAFLDIRMPGMTGLDVAERAAERCRIVFVTAYDRYAIEAFEKQAVDYLLKPVTAERLAMTVKRLKDRMAAGTELPADLIQRIAARLVAEGRPSRLQYVRVQHGEGVRLIPVEEVVYFKADDKYTLVVTGEGESLIRKPIKELGAELDPERFWQIHRSTIVNLRYIARVSRSLTGRGLVKLKGRPETLTVSARYLHLFRQM